MPLAGEYVYRLDADEQLYLVVPDFKTWLFLIQIFLRGEAELQS